MDDHYVWTANDEKVSHLLFTITIKCEELMELAGQMAINNPSMYLHCPMFIHIRNHYLDLVT
jgi:hypothetical protein